MKFRFVVQCLHHMQQLWQQIPIDTYSKNISDVKKGEAKKVQVNE